MVNFTKCIVLLKNKRITLAYQYNSEHTQTTHDLPAHDAVCTTDPLN